MRQEPQVNPTVQRSVAQFVLILEIHIRQPEATRVPTGTGFANPPLISSKFEIAFLFKDSFFVFFFFIVIWF